MPRKKVLLTVITYPLPSRSYDELVCTAGILEDGNWIRIYPVPLSFLKGIRKDGVIESYKYNWIELDLNKRTDDFRPESHSPKNYDFKDLRIIDYLGTERNWARRKEYSLKNVYTNLSKLIVDSKAPQNTSLATFKPSKIIGFEIEKDTREWKDEWRQLRKQPDLFLKVDSPEKLIPKVPYKFRYKFLDDEDRESTLLIEDWEIGALYWNCLKDSNMNESQAVEKVKRKYFDEFISKKDIFLFLGTTKQWHVRRALNPFVIIGVFYPKIESQLSLF